MNICIDARYVFPKIDGIGRYLINLIDKLSEITLGNENIHFYILEVEKFSQNSLLRKFDSRKNITFIKVPVLPQTIKNHFIRKYIQNLNIDIYHYPQFDLPWFVSGVKIVTSIMDINPQKLSEFFPTKLGWVKRYYSILTNWVALKKSDKLICISESTKKELIEFYNYKDSAKIECIHLGVNSRYFISNEIGRTTNVLENLKNRYNFDKYFLYVGNNRPHKNLEKVLTAFSNVLKKINFKIKFLLIGQQLNNNPSMKYQIEKLKIVDKVICLELNDDEMCSIYSNAQAFVFCSLSEGFGLPVLEAMSLGTPVITSNLSSMKEIAKGAALLVDPYSIPDIENNMLKILNDEDLRANLSKKGFERINEFTWEKCAEKTLQVYSSLLET